MNSWSMYSGNYYNDPSFMYANQGYSQAQNDSLINFGQSSVHTIPGYSPGGWSGTATPYADSQSWINFSDQYVIPNAVNTFNDVSNTPYYDATSVDQYWNYYNTGAQHLSNSNSTSNNLGQTLDFAAPNASQLMNQSTGFLSNYSATGSSLDSLLSFFS